jgi:DNA-binding NarL/FixJ family response regulator
MKTYEDITAEEAVALMMKGKPVFVIRQASTEVTIQDMIDSKSDPKVKYIALKEVEPQAESFREKTKEPKAGTGKNEASPSKETSDRDEKICMLFKDGETITNIAEEAGCSYQTVCNVLKRKGLRQ